MFNTIVTVTPLKNYILLVSFTDSTKKEYDVKPLFAKRESFASILSTRDLFEQVHVDSVGYGISWNDDIDLSCNGVQVGTST